MGQDAKDVSSPRVRQIEDWLRGLEETGRLSQGGHAVVQAAVQDPKFASYASAAQIAGLAQVNVATVTRTAQAVGFAGWPDWRQEIRTRYLGNLSAPELASIHEEEAKDEHPFDRALSRNIEQLAALRRRADRRAVSELAKHLAAARRRLVIGSGSFETMARILAHHATLCGYRSELATDGVGIANAMGDIGRGDVVVVVTFWRLYNSAIRAAQRAQARGAWVCVITDANVEPLSRHADLLIVAPAESSSFFPTVVPGLSVIEGAMAELAMIDPERSTKAIADFETEWQSEDLLYFQTAPMQGQDF